MGPVLVECFNCLDAAIPWIALAFVNKLDELSQRAAAGIGARRAAIDLCPPLLMDVRDCVAFRDSVIALGR